MTWTDVSACRENLLTTMGATPATLTSRDHTGLVLGFWAQECLFTAANAEQSRPIAIREEAPRHDC